MLYVSGFRAILGVMVANTYWEGLPGHDTPTGHVPIARQGSLRLRMTHSLDLAGHAHPSDLLAVTHMTTRTKTPTPAEGGKRKSKNPKNKNKIKKRGETILIAWDSIYLLRFRHSDRIDPPNAHARLDQSRSAISRVT